MERDLSVSNNRIGDVQTAQGDLVAVLTSYQASHSLFERLAAADPGNAGWPRALAWSFGRVPMGEAGQSARERALSQFQEGQDHHHATYTAVAGERDIARGPRVV